MIFQACSASWGEGHGKPWHFCTREKNHPGPCSCNGVEKPESMRFFEEQPEAAAEIERQRVAQAKEDARKGR